MIFEVNFADDKYERENKYGLIPISCFIFCNNIEISLNSIESFDITQFKKHIHNAISDIEGVNCKYFPNADVWEVEFGTKPIEFTVDNNDYELIRIINQKKWFALKSALKAIEKFPLLKNDKINYEQTEKWCMLDIYLRYCEKSHSIIIELNRTSGDIFAFYKIKNQFNDNLQRFII